MGTINNSNEDNSIRCVQYWFFGERVKPIEDIFLTGLHEQLAGEPNAPDGLRLHFYHDSYVFKLENLKIDTMIPQRISGEIEYGYFGPERIRSGHTCNSSYDFYYYFNKDVRAEDYELICMDEGKAQQWAEIIIVPKNKVEHFHWKTRVTFILLC